MKLRFPTVKGFKRMFRDTRDDFDDWDGLKAGIQQVADTSKTRGLLKVELNDIELSEAHSQVWLTFYYNGQTEPVTLSGYNEDGTWDIGEWRVCASWLAPKPFVLWKLKVPKMIPDKFGS